MDSPNGELLKCAFCGGSGTDPFNLLSERSRCECCQGRGNVSVPKAHVRCGFCNGLGNFKTFRCPVCKGTGVTAPVPEPTQTCPECDGRGYEMSSGLVCLKCGGRRLVTVY